jgi:hypothetical protein
MTVERCEIMALLARCVCVNIAFGAWRHFLFFFFVGCLYSCPNRRSTVCASRRFCRLFLRVRVSGLEDLA